MQSSTTPACRSSLLTLSGDIFVDLVRPLLSEGSVVRFRVRGSSMTPAVRNGDKVTVRPARSEDLARGEIALYRDEQNLPVIHRIVNMSGEGASMRFLLRGDAAPETERWICVERILGVVASVERGHSRRLSEWVRRLRRRVRRTVP